MHPRLDSKKLRDAPSIPFSMRDKIRTNAIITAVLILHNGNYMMNSGNSQARIFFILLKRKVLSNDGAIAYYSKKIFIR
jgi:hypothetical protein